MRVKKDKSKRKSTKLAKGIQKKVSAHNRKEKKLAKKDVTWKSRHPKDIGIPNSFPYKGQLLEEIESTRMKEAEEKELRRERQRELARSRGLNEDQVAEEVAALDAADNSNRLAALMASAQQAAAEYEGEGEDDIEMDVDQEDDEEEEVDFAEELDYSGKYDSAASEGSRKAFDKIFKEVVDASDVILYVLDARNPEGTRSKPVEKEVLSNANKRLIFVMNKIDLVPNDVLKRWKEYLELYFPTVPMCASSSAPNAKTFAHGSMNQITTATNLLQTLKKYAAKSQLKRSINVGIIGYPNVGKSSVINSLLSRHGGNKTSCPVGAQAGVTTSIRRVKIDNKLNILDSPGIVFPSSESKPKSAVDLQAKLILLNAVPPKQIVDPRPAVSLLLKRLARNEEQLNMLNEYYEIPPMIKNPHDEYVTGVLVHVARRMGRLKRGGVADLDGAGSTILTDWRDGRISGWALPPSRTKQLDIHNEEKNDLVEKSSGGDQKQIVTEWATEFSLDGLWDGTFDN